MYYILFLSTSLLGASRSYFFPPSPPPSSSNPPWNFLIFYINYTKYIEIQDSLSLSLSFPLLNKYNSCLFGLKFISSLLNFALCFRLGLNFLIPKIKELEFQKKFFHSLLYIFINSQPSGSIKEVVLHFRGYLQVFLDNKIHSSYTYCVYTSYIYAQCLLM